MPASIMPSAQLHMHAQVVVSDVFIERVKVTTAGTSAPGPGGSGRRCCSTESSTLNVWLTPVLGRELMEESPTVAHLLRASDRPHDVVVPGP